MAYNRLQSRHGAEDVVQDVLSSLWTRREQLSINSLNNYLSSAVRYSIFHEMRRRLKNDKLNQNFLVNAEAVTSTEELLKYKLIEEAVQKEINKLPEKCKLVFQYSRDLHMSNLEIAESLQLSSKTVEAHITRALRQLRSALKNALSSFFSIFF